MFSSTRSCDTRARRTRETVVRRRASSPNSERGVDERDVARDAQNRLITRRVHAQTRTSRAIGGVNAQIDPERDRSRAKCLDVDASPRLRLHARAAAPPRRKSPHSRRRRAPGSNLASRTHAHARRSLSLALARRALRRVDASRPRERTDPRERQTRVPIINHAPPSRVESTNASIHSFIHSFITHTHTHAHTRTHTRIHRRLLYSYTSASPKTEIINLI